MGVDAVPVPGVPDPLERTTWCPLPLQLAAMAGWPDASNAAATASMEVGVRFMGTGGPPSSPRRSPGSQPAPDGPNVPVRDGTAGGYRRMPPRPYGWHRPTRTIHE